MARPSKPPVARKTTTPQADVAHRLPGMKAPTTPAASPLASPQDDLNALLGDLNSQPATKTAKKSEKPVITLEGKAGVLLALQQDKAEYKTLEGRIAQHEGELLPEIEDHRLAINIAKQEYIGSIYVQATGVDEAGNPIQAGQALYYVQDRYSGFNPFALSSDDALQNRYGGKATLRDEAAETIMASLKVDRGTADGILKERMDVENNISLQEGALQNPEVVKILREHLAKFLVSTSKMTPTKSFHERSNYAKQDMAIMAALNNVGLCKRSKAVIKASGAPAQ